MTSFSSRNCSGAKVIILDSTRMGSESLGAKLKKDHCVILYAGTSASEAEAELPRADVALISATLGSDPDAGFAFSAQIRRSFPNVHVVILVDRSDFHSVVRSFRSGARGIFGRDGHLGLLSKCINRIRQGQVWASSEELQHLLEALSAPPRLRLVDSVGIEILAPREQEVVHWVAEGLTNREIADQLQLSANTVKNYLFRIFDKLGISNRVELILYVATQMAPQRGKSSTLAAAQALPGAENPEMESWRQAIARLAVPQFVLGEMYRDGRRVKQNKTTALMWFILAESVCQEFLDRSARTCEQLEGELPPAEVAIARRLAADHKEQRKSMHLVDDSFEEDQFPSVG